MRQLSVPTTPTELATHGGTNAIVAVMLGVYLIMVVYQGNLGALATAAKQDFLGTSGEPAFWRWAVALLILVALARNPKVNFLFGPLLMFALVGMLINVAGKNPAMLKNLQSGIKSLFQGQNPSGTSSTPQLGAVTPTPSLGPSLGSASGLLGMTAGATSIAPSVASTAAIEGTATLI